MKTKPMFFLKGNEIKTRVSRSRFLRAIAASIFLIFLQIQMGCTAMPNQDDVKFSTHSFDAECYDASNVRIVYSQTLYTPCREKLARKKVPDDDRRYPGGTTIGLHAFVGPVQVEWQSRDGEKHSQTLKLDEIFKDKIVLHKEDQKRIYKPMPISEGEPTIIVEVNDRTLNVYMDVTIQLIPSDPNAVRRDERRNRTLAYSNIF